jgi:hypothetical protein
MRNGAEMTILKWGVVLLPPPLRQDTIGHDGIDDQVLALGAWEVRGTTE